MRKSLLFCFILVITHSAYSYVLDQTRIYPFGIPFEDVVYNTKGLFSSSLSV